MCVCVYVCVCVCVCHQILGKMTPICGYKGHHFYILDGV